MASKTLTAKNFSDLMDYSATSVRTMKNSAGQIGFAPHNLILASEDFSDSNWTKTDTTVTSNAATAPDGTITADKITADSTSALIQNATITIPSNTSLITGLFLKYVDAQWVRVNMNDHNVWVDVQNKVLGTDATEGATLVELNDDWLYVYAPDTSPDTSYVSAIVIAAGDNNTARNNGGSAYIWGAHLYENGLAGMFDVPEDQRALASLTKYLPNKAVVTGPNLVSNGTFDSNTNGWNNSVGGDSSISVVSGRLRVTSGADGDAADDGAYQALSDLTVGDTYRVFIGERLKGTNGAVGVTVRTSTQRSLGSQVGGSVYTFADGANDAFYFTATASEHYLFVYGGYGTAGTYVEADNITVTKVDRDPTAARFLPRRNNHEYIDGAWVEGLKAESEARTNLVINALDLTASGWINTWGGGTTLTADAAVSPSGQTDATEVAQIDGSGDGVYDSISVSSATDYSFSAYVKNVDSTKTALNAYNNSTNEQVNINWSGASISSITTSGGGNISNEGYIAVGDDWYWVYGTVTTAATTVNFIILPENSAVATNSVYVWGVQFEAGSTPSSLIPTYGATRTRTAETFTQKSDKIIWPNTTYVDGTELVTNGTFDTDVSGWTAYNDAVLSVDTGQLKLANNVTNYGATYQNLTLVSGETYTVSFDLDLGTSTRCRIAVGTSLANESVMTGVNITANGSYAYTFTAGATNTLIFVNNETADTSYILLDNVSVKEINPRALCVVMHGYMTYAESASATQDATFWRQYADADNNFYAYLTTATGRSGRVTFLQEVNSTVDFLETDDNLYAGGINVPFKIASRHLDNAVQGAADGTATTENTTPPGLPDLSATQAEWFYDFMGHVTDLRVWTQDITEAGLTGATS